MQKDNSFFDDFRRLASSATGEFMAMTRELEGIVSAKVEQLLQKMNYATSEEVQTVLDMLSKLRNEQEILSKRLENLEKRVNAHFPE